MTQYCNLADDIMHDLIKSSDIVANSRTEGQRVPLLYFEVCNTWKNPSFTLCHNGNYVVVMSWAFREAFKNYPNT